MKEAEARNMRAELERLQTAPVPAVTEVNPLLADLQAHMLDAYYNQLVELGAKTVEDFTELTDSDLQELGMKRLDIKRFVKAFHLNAKVERAHFGDTRNAAGPGATLPAGKHVMLSYQWDSQKTVVKVREGLIRRGLQTWMDIDGGMRSDVYDSMAEGVQNSWVLAAFMTQRYQDSQNCKLELKFAASTETPVVPVMLQPNWRASDWLGILTAGALWVPLHDEASIEKDIDVLYGQLLKLAPEVSFSASSDEAFQESFTLSEMRAELDNLRKEIHSTQNSDGTPEGDKVATLPAEVPTLPVTFRFTADMYSLKRLLMSKASSDGNTQDQTMSVTSQPSDSSHRVGAFGMGGIGKTMVCVWACLGR
jgi:hypothetical protein